MRRLFLLAAALLALAVPATAQLWNAARQAVVAKVAETVFDNGGAPWPFFSKVSAINYDKGGTGIGFNSPVSPSCPTNGSSYRSDYVNFNPPADGETFVLGCTAAGTWYRYTTNFSQAGPYAINLRTASSGASGTTWTFLLDGTSIGQINAPDTGSFTSFTTTQSPQFNAPLGNHIIELLAGGNNCCAGDISSFVGVNPSIPVAGAGCPQTNWSSCALMGTYQAENLAHWCTVMSRCPDFVVDNTYTLPGAQGSDPASNNPYPVITIIQLFGGSVPYGTSYASVTAGNHDSDYAATDSQIANYSSHVYAVRTNSESCFSCGFSGPNSINCDVANRTDCPSDLADVRANPSHAVNAWRHRIQLLKQHVPGVKVIYDGPRNPDDDVYWVGDDLADLTGTDNYIFNFAASGEAQWEDQSNCGQPNPPCAASSSKGHLASFAAQHGKPMVISEWCDMYTDGVALAKEGLWMSMSNVVAQMWWNSVNDGGGFDLCGANFNNGKLTAYQHAFGVPYVGGYWPTHLGTIDGRYQ